MALAADDLRGREFAAALGADARGVAAKRVAAAGAVWGVAEAARPEGALEQDRAGAGEQCADQRERPVEGRGHGDSSTRGCDGPGAEVLGHWRKPFKLTE